MIILLVILAIIAIAGFAITTALRKGLDPKDEYDKDRLKILGIIRVRSSAAVSSSSLLRC